MVFVDRLEEIDGLQCRSTFKIQQDNIFLIFHPLEKGRVFSEFGMTENIAQTSLAFIRSYFEHKGGDIDGFIGYISNILNLEVMAYPKLGETIHTETRTELVYQTEFLKICTIDAVITVDRKKAMTASMKMILQTADGD